MNKPFGGGEAARGGGTEFCRICGQPALDEAWVELPDVGRFWLCARHDDKAECVFFRMDWGSRGSPWVYTSKLTGNIVLGPYPHGVVGAPL